MLNSALASLNKRLVLLAVVLVSLMLAAAASTAQATTVSATSTTLYVYAAVGESNDVSISFSGGQYLIADAGTSTLTAKTGCTKTGATVYCAQPSVSSIRASLGDGDNALTVGAGIPSALMALIVRAEAGSDVIDTTALPVTTNSDIGLGGGDYESVSVGPGSNYIETGEVVYSSWISGNSGSDTISASGGDAIDLVTLSGGSAIYGYGGYDSIDTTSMTGGAFIDPGAGDDLVMAGTGGDYVVGGDGSDEIYMGEGGDLFEQTPNATGSHSVEGNDGDDRAVIWPNGASVSFDGSAGVDSVDYVYSPGSVAISLDGVGNDGNAGSANDNIQGTVESIGPMGNSMKYNDTLVGNSVANTIHGRNGSDVITGGGGADALYGDAGNDTIHAADGVADSVNCGTQTDTVYADFADSVNSNCENVYRS